MVDLRSRRMEVEEDPVALFEEFYQRGWTDGLPIIPPTPRRIQEMLAGAGRDPAEVLAAMPPRMAPVSVEKVATNAVMAGCLPAYLPVVLAVIEAISDPDFNLRGINSTTSPACVTTLVNGPIRHQLDINCGYGCMGPGWRANATIGRAIRLVQLNVGGAVPGTGTKSTHGQPGRFTLCFGELEEKNPWSPLHVDRGFQAEESTVTVLGTTCTISIADTESKTARGTLTTLAHSMDGVGTNHMAVVWREGESLLVLCPDHAMVLQREGWSKEDVKRFLYANTQVPLARFSHERHERMVSLGRTINGLAPLHSSPDDFLIAVAGGLGGYHSTWLPTWGNTRAITRKVRLPGPA